MGILRVDGMLNIEQFWYQGDSDADTTKIEVGVNPDAFQFQSRPGTSFQVTQAFKNTEVRGNPTIRNEKITVRLQGVDAPELHYIPQPFKRFTEREKLKFQEWNHKFRQKMAETATNALYEFLKQAGASSIPCRVVTAVKKPNDVFDIYARFVGDILIDINDSEVNLNVWLIKSGWALPSLYNSMSDDEIETLIAAAKEASQQQNNLWTYLSNEAKEFDYDLRFRPAGSSLEPDVDAAPFIFPKLFRRQCNWATAVKAELYTDNLASFLKLKRDECYLTEDFLAEGTDAAETRHLDEFLSDDGVFDKRPEELVFRERPATLKREDGSTVTRW